MARALRVLAEIGLAEIGPGGVRPAARPGRRELSESPTYRRCAARLAEAREFLGRAATLDLAAGPSEAPPALAASG